VPAYNITYELNIRAAMDPKSAAAIRQSLEREFARSFPIGVQLNTQALQQQMQAVQSTLKGVGNANPFGQLSGQVADANRQIRQLTSNLSGLRSIMRSEAFVGRLADSITPHSSSAADTRDSVISGQSNSVRADAATGGAIKGSLEGALL